MRRILTLGLAFAALGQGQDPVRIWVAETRTPGFAAATRAALEDVGQKSGRVRLSERESAEYALFVHGDFAREAEGSLIELPDYTP